MFFPLHVFRWCTVVTRGHFIPLWMQCCTVNISHLLSFSLKLICSKPVCRLICRQYVECVNFVATHAYLWNFLTLASVNHSKRLKHNLLQLIITVIFFSCSLYMQAVRPRTSPLPAFGGRSQNRNAQFCSTWAWNWRSYGMLHSCWFCVFV